MRMLGELADCEGGLFLGETAGLFALLSSTLGGGLVCSGNLVNAGSGLLSSTVLASTA